MEQENQTTEAFKPNTKSADVHAIKRLYELTLRVRDFEITQLSQRNNFFMLFQGVLFAGLATLLQNSSGENYASLICFIGAVVSIFQIGISSGAKYWQEFWEEAVSKTEKELIDVMTSVQTSLGREKIHSLFSMDMKDVDKSVRERLERSKANRLIKYLILKKYSVSRIPIWAGLFFLFIWSLLFVHFLFNVSLLLIVFKA